MRGLLVLFIFYSLNTLAANEKFITRIHSIKWSERAADAHLIKFENARVAFMHNLTKSNTKLQLGELVEVEVTEEQKLISLLKLQDNYRPISVNDPFVVDAIYRPTMLDGPQQANAFFKALRENSLPHSQSFDRAHVWAFEEFQRSGLQSMKSFLFFSDNFIRKHKFKWWFHVAPLVSYRTQGKIKEIILDKTVANAPLALQQWSDKISQKRSVCKVIKKISAYLASATGNDCYVLKTSMFFWQPKDLELWENIGIKKVQFYEWEIEHSFANAFGISSY